MIFLLACVAEKNIDTATTEQDQSAHLSWDVAEKGPHNIGYTTQNMSYDLLGQERRNAHQHMVPNRRYIGRRGSISFLRPRHRSFSGCKLGRSGDRARIPGPCLFLMVPSSMVDQAPFLPRHFASHGWVVAAPDHTGHLLTDYGDSVEASTFYLRPHNINAAIEAVASLDNVHTESVIVSGFSFGATDNWMIAGAEMNMESIQAMCDDGTLPSGCRDDEYALLQAGFANPRVKGIVPMAELIALNGYQHRDDQSGHSCSHDIGNRRQ